MTVSNGSHISGMVMGRQFIEFLSNFTKLNLLNVPIAVNFDITYKCNLKCEHCYYWTSVHQLGIKHWELSDEQWLDVFSYYKGIGVKNVSLTGGEPTLRMNLIENAHEYFPQVQTATNGMIRIPTRVQPKGIWLSIDGPKEVHDKIRHAKNCFDTLVNNYQDDRRVAVSSTISTTNYKHVEDIVKICQDLGVKGVFFMLYSGSKENPLYPKGNVYRKIMADLTKVIREYPGFVLITDDMLQAYHNKDFIKTCPFLGKRPAIRSFYADMTPKRCVMGDNVDCTTCSCIVPVGTYVMTHNTANLENYKKLTKILF